MNLNENKRLVSPCGNGRSLGPKWPKIGLIWPKVVFACGYSEKIIFASDKIPGKKSILERAVRDR